MLIKAINLHGQIRLRINSSWFFQAREAVPSVSRSDLDSLELLELTTWITVPAGVMYSKIPVILVFLSMCLLDFDRCNLRIFGIESSSIKFMKWGWFRFSYLLMIFSPFYNVSVYLRFGLFNRLFRWYFVNIFYLKNFVFWEKKVLNFKNFCIFWCLLRESRTI